MEFIKWDKVNIRKLIDYSSIAIVVLFFLIHIYLGIFYHSFDGYYMTALNHVSLIVIAICGLFLWKKKYQIMFNVLFVEAIFHMFMATVSFGWDCGFQNYQIALVVVFFFIDYCSKKTKDFEIKSVKFSFASFMAYTISFITSFIWDEPFHATTGAVRVNQFLSSIVVFAIVTVFSWILIQFTFRIESRMSVQAHSDKLTGLPNRYYFTENFDELMRKCTKEKMFMAIMDIDDFKKVNDTYGHNAGDYVLKAVASIIQSKCNGMVVCRWGGEEFLLSGEADGTDEDAVRKLCKDLDNIRKSIGNYDFSYEGNKFRITLTMGMSLYGEGETIEDWIDCADKKLYSGKMSGKNKLVY